MCVTMSVISWYVLFDDDMPVNIINLSYVLFTFYQTVLSQAFIIPPVEF